MEMRGGRKAPPAFEFTDFELVVLDSIEH